MMGQVVHAALIETQRAAAPRNQSGSCNRVAACKKSYVMSRTDQFLRKIRDDPLRPAVMFGRDAFNQRRNLSNSHLPSLCSLLPKCKSFVKQITAECAFAPKKPDLDHSKSRNVA